MRLARFTGVTGRPLAVNPDQVVLFETDVVSKRTMILMAGGATVPVQETFDEACALLVPTFVFRAES